MGSFLSYTLQAGMYLLAFYLSFRLVLSRERQFAFCRRVILMIYLASAILPWLTGLWQSADVVHVLSEAIPLEAPAGEVAAQGEVFSLPARSGAFWCQVLLWVYLAGALGVLLHTLAGWIGILRLVRRGERRHVDGILLVLTDDCRVSPFSWMRCVVMSRRDWEKNGAVILAHERAHIRRKHSADLLLAQAVACMAWYNPAAWLMREELALVHEYEADMDVIQGGIARQDYQLLLIEKAVGKKFPGIANSLRHHQLKKRFTMMQKTSTRKSSRLRALALLPAAAFVLGALALPPVKNTLTALTDTHLRATPARKPSDGNPVKVISAQMTAEGNCTHIKLKIKGAKGICKFKNTQVQLGTSRHDALCVAHERSGDTYEADIVFPLTFQDQPSVVQFELNGQPYLVGFTKNGASWAMVNADADKGGAQGTLSVKTGDGMAVAQSLDATEGLKTTAEGTGATSEGTGGTSEGTGGTSEGADTYYLDGEEIPEADLASLNADDIEAITVQKMPDGTRKVFIQRKKSASDGAQ